MSKWDKLLLKICSLSKELRFNELRKVLESYGFMLKWSKILLKVRYPIMKNLDDYLSLPYRMEIVPDTEEGGYVVAFPDLPGCITCGETLDSAITNAMDAKKSWLEAALADGITIPEPDSLEHYSGQFKIRIPKSLHRELSEHSKKEGISMNQYCLYLLSKNDALFSKQG